MEEVEKLFKSSTEEMEKLLTAKSVVGEPMVVDGYTIVPLLSLSFGFGAGGGGGQISGGVSPRRGGRRWRPPRRRSRRGPRRRRR